MKEEKKREEYSEEYQVSEEELEKMSGGTGGLDGLPTVTNNTYNEDIRNRV